MIENKPVKLNIGCGRKRLPEFINLDIMPFVDGKGNQMVDVVIDVEKEVLPYEDNTVELIVVNNVLEHIGELRFFLNECHRVLKKEGMIRGNVPVAGTKVDFQDPTHKRHFIKGTFGYFTGVSGAKKDRPSHPRYADYGYLPWNELKLEQENDLIYFELSPRK